MPLNVKELMKQVGKIRVITNRLVDEHLSGEYHSVFKGHGIEFDEVREYVPGDDIRSIDWNVTARMGVPFVKRFCEERELTILFLVDVSGSQSFGSGSRAKAELAAEVTCLLALSAIKNQDKIGLILFSDRIEKSIPPRKGRTAAMRLVREVLATEETRRGTDLAGALRFLNQAQKRRAVVFVISDFMDNAGKGFTTEERRLRERGKENVAGISFPPSGTKIPATPPGAGPDDKALPQTKPSALFTGKRSANFADTVLRSREIRGTSGSPALPPLPQPPFLRGESSSGAFPFERELRVTARRHDVICCHLSDPREAEIPDVGLIEIQNPETGELELLDTSSRSLREAFRDNAKRESEALSRLFRKHRIDALNLSTSRPFIEDIHKLFHQRQTRAARG